MTQQIILAFCSLLLLAARGAPADVLVLPNTLSNDTPADAAAVQENFQALADESNENDARITSNSEALVASTPWAWTCSPANTLQLYSNVSSGQQEAFEVINADGSVGAALVLSSTEALVVTDVLVTPNTGSGQYLGNIDNSAPGGGPYNRIRFVFNNTMQGMLHLPLTTGVVFLQPPLAFASATNPGAMVVRLLGCIGPATG